MLRHPPFPLISTAYRCCAAFRKLRQLFGIDTTEYMLSLCGDQALRELPSPGKSGRWARAEKQ